MFPLQACLYAIGAYNSCLGEAETRAADAQEDANAASAQADQERRQLVEEKMNYMKQASAGVVRKRGGEVGFAGMESCCLPKGSKVHAAPTRLDSISCIQGAGQSRCRSRWRTLAWTAATASLACRRAEQSAPATLCSHLCRRRRCPATRTRLKTLPQSLRRHSRWADSGLQGPGVWRQARGTGISLRFC